MSEQVPRVSTRGAIVLAPQVVCDGFVRAAPLRVQTHIHDDHMDGFDSSKGYQTILMSQATRELLIAEFNAELPVRSNIRGVPVGRPLEEQGVKITLYPSEHMLGAVQVAVTLEDGTRIGYSGDFNWPLEEIPKLDVLVVDSTYGSPGCTRAYSRQDVEARFIEIVLQRLPHGPVHVKAHRGTVEGALELLDAARVGPLVATPRLHKEIEVYRRFGYSIGTVYRSDSEEGMDAVAQGRYVRIYSKGDGGVFGLSDGTAITLSAYMAPRDDPLLEYAETAYRVALSGHADFEETLEYVAATEAKFVITDTSRSEHARSLAEAIKRRLRVPARPAELPSPGLWGS